MRCNRADEYHYVDSETGIVKNRNLQIGCIQRQIERPGQTGNEMKFKCSKSDSSHYIETGTNNTKECRPQVGCAQSLNMCVVNNNCIGISDIKS